MKPLYNRSLTITMAVLPVASSERPYEEALYRNNSSGSFTKGTFALCELFLLLWTLITLKRYCWGDNAFQLSHSLEKPPRGASGWTHSSHIEESRTVEMLLLLLYTGIDIRERSC